MELKKVKLSPGLINYAPRHENLWGNEGAVPLFLTSVLAGGGQLHAPATLPPGKEPPVPTVQEAGRAPVPVWSLWRTEKSLAPVRNRSPTVQAIIGRWYTD
jgi:hypothetical protein